MAKSQDQDVSQATNDAYTGMLSISLLALIGGCVLLFLDFQQYPDSNPPAIPKAPPLVKLEPGGPAVPEPKPPVVPPPPQPKEPQPKEPEPKEPAPKEPAPKEPAPKEPEPKEPAPKEPAPKEPEPKKEEIKKD